MRESYSPFGATIRYRLIVVHRRGLVQSLIGRSPFGATGFGSEMLNLASAFYRILQFFRQFFKTQNPVDSLILGLGGRNFCPPSLSPLLFLPPQFFVFRFAKCAANKEVVFAPPAHAHTTDLLPFWFTLLLNFDIIDIEVNNLLTLYYCYK